MSSRTYRIRGTAIDHEVLPATYEITIKRQRRLIPGRARDGVTDELDVSSDEVVRVELNNGFVHWLRCDDLVREYGRHTVSRDGAEVWEFGALAPPLTGSDSRDERGLLGLAIKVLDFFGCDIEKRSARKLGEVAEKRLLKGHAHGFYRCSLGDEFSLKPVGRKVSIPVDKGPILVFIHGTASSCRGSFGKLWEPNNRSGREARKRLEKCYGDRVFAFEHFTLTESPISNALELAGRLPKGGEIHLVSHSRGGMVGELLCLAGCENLASILTPGKLKTLFAADRTIGEQLALSPLDQQDLQDRDSAYEKDRKALLRLVRLLNDRFAVKRFVRVACPARGTTLASGRLDRWLSMLSFLLQKVTGEGLFGDGVDFLFSVVKERTDPRVLPGLEAMMPGSALTRLLQYPELVTRSDLSVIAGDLDGSALQERLSLKRLVADWFYSADNDLVVNTGSMSGGLKRPPKGARYLKDQGAQVDHFSYFGNQTSIEWLVAGLIRADDDNGGFHPIEAAQKERPVWLDVVAASRSVATPRPLALVLPGTMGSQLKAGDDLVWLDYWSLFRGGLKKIAMASGDEVSTTDEVIGEYYGPLLEFLARTHRLEVVAYDWRLSVCAAAEKLMERLESCLPLAEKEHQPVHLVAHSMGGLVVRAMIADRQRGQALWQRVTRLPNSRFLMLGTPNRGSYEALRWLTGTNPTEAKLSLLDMTQSTDDIVDLVREFPGLLELLPIAEEPKFAGLGLWRTIKQTTRAGWKTAKPTALSRAAETWELLNNAPPLDPRFACYVAGSQPATVIGYRFSEYDEPWLVGRKRLEFLASAKGDGTVSWSSGKLPDLPVWYVEDTAHDALCTQQRAFAGYLDILMTGATTRLSEEEPVVAHRGAEGSERFVLPPLPPVDSIPAPEELSRLTFSGNAPLSAERGAVAPTIEICVRHGNLAYARHPVLVGHYLGDTIVSAEASLNRHLNGALERCLDLEIYPGYLNSHAHFFNESPRGKPGGAIVVGLGQVGELTPGLLCAGVASALLDYALRVAFWPDDRFGKPGAPRRASVTCLLVGTGAGGIQVCDSLEAILRGAVEANLRLVKANMDSRVTIDRLEFLELYEDVAIAATESLRGLLMDGELAAAVRWPVQVVESGQAGLRRVRHDEPPEWWHRLEIFAEKERPGLLRFSFSTDRARVEETLSRGQLDLADAFVESVSASTGSNTEVARTLFEMLLPLRLKESTPRQDNLVLMVDDRSARYPWELLEDRWSNDARPPSVRAGMVRQLKTPDFRSRPAHAVEAKALVVGNPNLDGCERFSDLPGARSEARKVVELLRERKFQVEGCLDANHGEIIHSLHKEAWRILHLAGHGVHEYLLPDASEASPERAQDSALVQQPEQRRSGMVIGCGKILTPGDVEQMRWVPELVFINCCHLGKGGDRQGLQRGPLAANLGMHFIRMGVRAVVAAGWAVDDTAALIFAESFYRHMLDGDEFGEAVRAAREETWLRVPDSNTWGAYQCYGDQGYRLHKDGRGPVRRVRSFSAPIELETELNNLACALRVGEKGLEEIVEERISQLRDRCPDPRQASSWFGRADVTAALGFVWGEARRWPAAIETLEKALQANEGDCPIRAVEQCANYKVRSAAEAWFALSRGRAAEREVKRQEFIRIIESSILEMDLLCQRAVTVERLSLLGSAYKRLAMVQNEREQRKTALLNMARYYRRALEMGGGSDPYPFTNWACAQLLLSRLDPALAKFDPEPLLSGAERIEKQRVVSNENDPNFWDSASIADIALVKLLVRCDGQQKMSPECESLVGLIIATYGDAIARGASPREIASLIDHLDFLQLLIEPRAPLSKAIRQIKGSMV